MPLQNHQNFFSMNYVIDRILADLGASNRKVEFENMQIGEIIATQTLPEYSKYFPWEFVAELKESNRNTQLGTGFYFLDTPTTVINVDRLVGGLDKRAAIGGGNSTRNFTDEIDLTLTGTNLAFSLTSARDIGNINAITTLGITTKFIPPNVVEIFPKQWYDGNTAMCLCIHPVTLHTIGWRMGDYFYKLAKCDVFMQLKNLRKKFGRIATIYGEIELNLEELEKAEDEKKELLELFKNNSILRAGNKRWYVA